MICRVRIRALAPDPPDYQTDQRFTLRQATRDDLYKASRDMPDQLSAEFIDASLCRGDVCTAAFDGLEMVAFSWFSFSCAPGQDGTWVDFDKPYRYIYKSYTRPDYRGMRLQPPLLFLLDGAHLDRGYTHTIAYVESHNYASIATGVAAGAKWVGYAGYVRCFGRVFPFRTRGTKRHTLRFLPSEPSRPSAELQ
jgi:hypothetical protein